MISAPAASDPALALAEELAARWLPSLLRLSWAERLLRLHEIHEQLQEDLEDLDLYSKISPLFIKKIIEGLNDGPIATREQAHVYANSGDPGHRRDAGEWFARQSNEAPDEAGF